MTTLRCMLSSSEGNFYGTFIVFFEMTTNLQVLVHVCWVTTNIKNSTEYCSNVFS